MRMQNANNFLWRELNHVIGLESFDQGVLWEISFTKSMAYLLKLTNKLNALSLPSFVFVEENIIGKSKYN